MSLGRKVSDHAHASIFDPSDLDSSNGHLLPEPIFLRFTASKKEVKEYRAKLLRADAPSANFWVPKRSAPQRNRSLPSASNVRSLDKLRSSRTIPDSVQLRLPEYGQDAENPPPGYFTCYEAYILNCQLWFPIPRVIVEFLDRFKLSISQLFPSALQHVIGILVLGYERGMSLSADYLEAMLFPKRAGGGFFYMAPRGEFSVIEKLASNGHEWKDWFFYIRIDDASVEEGGIPLLRTMRATEASSSRPPSPGDLSLVRSLLRGGPFYWGHFSPKRVRRAIDYYLSGFSESGCAKAGADDRSEVRERSRSPQEKDVPIDQDPWFDENLNVEDYIDFSVSPQSEMPAESPYAKASRLVNKGFWLMNEAARASDAETRMHEFRAEAAEMEAARIKEEIEANLSRAQEMAETEIARVRSECEADSRRAIEFSEARIRRARRAGKRQVAAEMAARRERFAPLYEEVRDAQKVNGEYRECRGIVGGLYLTQDAGYSYEAVSAKQKARLNKQEKRKTELPDFEARMWEQWKPIAVSPDSCEVGPEIPDASGEVDQSRTDAYVGQSSASGFYDFD